MPHFELLENLIYMILLSWGIMLLIYHHGVVSRKKLVFTFIPNSDVESWINHPQVAAYNIYPWIPRGSFLVFISFVFISPLSITKKAYILVCLAWVLLKLFRHILWICFLFQYVLHSSTGSLRWEKKEEKSLLDAPVHLSTDRHLWGLLDAAFQNIYAPLLIWLICVIPYEFHLLMWT